MKTVIEMAREAGFNPDDFDSQDCQCDECNFLRPMLERFAALVIKECAEECIMFSERWMYGNTPVTDAELLLAKRLAANITRLSQPLGLERDTISPTSQPLG